MNNICLDATRNYIIYCNNDIEIYSIYEKPYFYLGERRCGLIMSSSDKTTLINILDESGAKYIETEEDPEKMPMDDIRQMFKEKYEHSNITQVSHIDNMNLQIIYTCPKCGADTQEIVLTSYPPKRLIRCTKCDWENTEGSEVIRVPYPAVNSFNTVPDYCRSCPNHLSNGGSGVCHCTLGTPVIYNYS